MKRRQTTEAVQYTIRNVPQAVDRALRRKAARMARSLNEIAVEALASGSGAAAEVAERHDLDFLFDSWVEDPAVDESFKAQRKIDKAMWK
jgi:predicted nucleotidyltransferase